ncbi:hypothetical protein ZYGR_0H05240 [Zygosaccharomyces rouxii]|uniref:ZYRO0B16104p n=2 Tax=Zygosaccharomyces rouxii TaxID=4956 RepID=C5DSE0_ZYGRC|nr:uncharacterized protein ZYRO0B16104g [Zygosaccharomyces rouxii]KAH9199768.1 hypothetical protein LQ764DRAFT_104874 [Zygosaccharomyces rouxii]GAV47678.1 hypothetical protein ZYGR_0H05240 [Zygosaccharomyces rouxii]CAR26701.1 ZYRO0B16104p [Zygosaccharomyces rouxii]
MDIRYNFLNTLDHFPCELIRTLWTLQSLDTSLDQNEDEDNQDQIAVQMENQVDFLEDLVQSRIKTLTLQRNELLQMQEIRRRYDATRSKDSSKNAPLTIRLNLRNSNSNRVDKASRASVKNNTGKPNITRREEPQEETYCVCHNVSYGSMIACDNDSCSIEWFHYGCVGIVRPLEGEWYCSEKCRREAKKNELGSKKGLKR